MVRLMQVVMEEMTTAEELSGEVSAADYHRVTLIRRRADGENITLEEIQDAKRAYEQLKAELVTRYLTGEFE